MIVHAHDVSARQQHMPVVVVDRVERRATRTGTQRSETPGLTRRRPSLMYCGGDQHAKDVTATLIRDIGFDPVDAGPLRIARYLEPFALAMSVTTTPLISLEVASSLGPPGLNLGQTFMTVERKCPACGQAVGLARRVSTVPRREDIVVLEMVCGSCSHEWSAEVVSPSLIRDPRQSASA